MTSTNSGPSRRPVPFGSPCREYRNMRQPLLAGIYQKSFVLGYGQLSLYSSTLGGQQALFAKLLPALYSRRASNSFHRYDWAEAITHYPEIYRHLHPHRHWTTLPRHYLQTHLSVRNNTLQTLLPPLHTFLLGQPQAHQCCRRSQAD